jgi:hypothetical protein
LDPGRETINAVFSAFHPFYPCNKKDERRRAFPTLVAFPISCAFRDLNAGTVYDTISQTLTQPNVSERESLMGYSKGITWTPTISNTDRHMIIGRAMDATCLAFLFSIYQTLYFHKWSPQHTSATAIPVGHNAKHPAAVAMVAQYKPPEDSDSPSDGNDTRHWWQIDGDTPVGGLGMAFASLQGASSDIHQAQQFVGRNMP